jgi:hypothetical protein
MYDTRKVYKHGSTEEAIAIYVINRNRTAKLIEALIGVAAPENVDKLYKQYKGVLFPEEKYDELAYLRKVRGMMEKLRGVTLRVAPVATPKRRK